MPDYSLLAQSFLSEMKKTDSDPAEMVQALAEADEDVLFRQLHSRELRLAFWINLYNSYSLFFLKPNPGQLSDRASRTVHFRSKQIHVAGQALSLDDLEHGLLRRSKWKYSLGYIQNPFPGRFEKRFRMAKVDPRIHFALNCGGASCPPIRYYQPERIDMQLEIASGAFMESESRVLEDGVTLEVSTIMSWFRGDFGGKGGILRFAGRYLDLPAGIRKLKFKPYDWTVKLDAFA